MFTKLFVCLLLIISAAKALPAADVKSEKKELSCIEKIQWYHDVTDNARKMYDEHVQHLQNANFTKDTNASPEAKNAIATIVQIFDSNIDLGIDYETAIGDKPCQSTIDTYKKMIANLTKAAIDYKSKSLDLIAQAESKDDLHKTVSSLVNFLLIIDSKKYTFTDMPTLVKNCMQFVDNGEELEKKWKLNENGEVEVTDDSDSMDYTYEDIEKGDKNKELDDEIRKNMEELEKPLPELVPNQDDDDEIYIPGKYGFLQRMIHENPTLAAVLISLIFLSMLVSLLLWVARQWESRTRYTTFT